MGKLDGRVAIVTKLSPYIWPSNHHDSVHDWFSRSATGMAQLLWTEPERRPQRLGSLDAYFPERRYAASLPISALS